MKFVNTVFNWFNNKEDKHVLKQNNDAKKASVETICETGPCNYDDAVELTGNGRYNYLQLLACCVICNAVSIDMFGFGVVLAAASCDLHLGIFETAILASLPFTGIFYSFPWGYFSDHYGRRRALQFSTTAGFLFAALACFSPNWQTMLVLKLIGYANSSAGINLSITYLGESTGNAHRDRYLFLINSADLAAEFVFYFLAYFILPLEFAIPVPWLGIVLRPWRVYTLLLAAPLGLGALLLLLLHESPKFLASRGKEDRALKVLTAMFVANGGKGEYPVKTIAADNVDDPTQSFWSSVTNQVALLFKPPLVWRTLQLFYILAACCSTNSVFVMWYPAIMNVFFNSMSEGQGGDQSFCQRVTNASVTFSDTGHPENCDDTISLNTIYCGVALSVFFVTLNLAASAVAKYRRLLLLASLLVPAVSLVFLEFVYEPIASIVLFTLVQCTAVGIGCVATYFVDLYPTAFRGLVTSLGLSTGQLVSLGGVNLVGGFILDNCSATFYGWAAFVASAIVATLFLPSDSVRQSNK